jgi:hypothetical protein
MSRRRRWSGLLGSILLVPLAALPALAQQVSEGPGDSVHGFASQGFVLTTGNEYLVTDSKRGSFQLSEVGVNYSRELTQRLRFGVQLFAQNSGFAGNWTPQVDWFYLEYRFRDWFGLRAGRLKIPQGLYNEVNDVDSARVPILLPQWVYPLQFRSILFAQTGAELYGFARLRGAGAIDYRLFGGTIHVDPKLVVPPGTPLELAFNVPLALGGRLLWETPLPGLRLGGSLLRLRLDTVAFLPMGMTVGIENNTTMWVASLEYMFRTLAFTAEYRRSHTKQESVIPTSNLEVKGEGGYAMLTMAVASWFQPAVYYSLSFPDVEVRDGLSNKQHDLALTLRFDINPYWLIKLEGHYMAGTAGLVNPARVTAAPIDAEGHWAVFLAKATVSF